MLWILDLDSIVLIVILFFAQALFSPHSSHAMTELSNACIPDLSLFTHALFVWLTNALINLISYHALHGVDKVSALLLPNVACHTAYSSHECCLSGNNYFCSKFASRIQKTNCLFLIGSPSVLKRITLLSTL